MLDEAVEAEGDEAAERAHPFGLQLEVVTGGWARDVPRQRLECVAESDPGVTGRDRVVGGRQVFHEGTHGLGR